MTLLITGTAGFIGYHVVKRFVELGYDIVGVDDINNYYSVDLKFDRLAASGIAHEKIEDNKPVQSNTWRNYSFIKTDIQDRESIRQLFQKKQFDIVLHFAAQAGVRYSLENPEAYIQGNVAGFLNILEACRHFSVPKLIYASSSSVYGLTEKEIFTVGDRTDSPASLYAATKKSNELMAHVYSHLYGITTIGLRFFTVYGPWGRPDMAPFLFTDAIIKGKEINVFNHGNMLRDFTYIDDIAEGIYRVANTTFPSKYNLFNIGNSKPVQLLEFIKCLETELGMEARKKMCDMQPGDVVATWADVEDLMKATGYAPATDISLGVKQFIHWYRNYFNV